MSGILALGRGICGATSYFSPETCALPLSQRSALLAIPVLFLVANQARKGWQNRSVQNLNDANVLQMARHGNHKGIQRYIAAKKDLEIVDPTSGNTLLMEASKNGHFGIVRDLLVAKANPNTINNSEETALHMACSARFYEIADRLLLNGANSNAKDSHNNTPLMNASQKGAVKIVGRLLQAESIQVDEQNKKRQTALHLAAKEYPEVVWLLLETGNANPNIPDEDLQIPLHYATDAECEENLELFLKHTTDVNVPDKEGNTALHLTATNMHGLPKSAEVLLKDPQTDPNRLNEDGESPLHVACYGMAGNHDLALQMIASKRFDLSLPTDGKKKQTPMEMAKEQGFRAKTLIEALSQKKRESEIKEKSSTLFPPDATWEHGSALEEPTVESCTKEYLEKIQVGELTLSEWAVVHFDQQLINALNKKDVYFKLSEEKKDQLTIELIRFGHKCLQYLGKNPIQIAEHQKILKEVEEFVANPDFEKMAESEILELWRETAHSYLKQCEIISRHKKEGSHLYGNEVLSGNSLFELRVIKVYLDTFLPGPIRAQMDMTTTMSREELMDQMGVPQNIRRIHETVRSMEELIKFEPVVKAFKADQLV